MDYRSYNQIIALMKRVTVIVALLLRIIATYGQDLNRAEADSLRLVLNQLRQSRLEREGLVRNFTIGGIGLLLIIIALLYRQYRQKQKSSNVISGKNDLLQRLVTEKEWLLKEIHHRVKNNFQTVMGLLGTQTGYLKNESAADAIRNSQHRIQSMSLIHQRLYQTENLSAINMTGYIYELVDYLSESFNINNRIRFDLQIEPIELDLGHCIPLGLILNEAITNSFKYAFPNGKEGMIIISLASTSGNHLSLTVKDNGIGLPAKFSAAKTDSMGMNLMRGLSAEIGACFSIINQNGTYISVSFMYEPDVIAVITHPEIEKTYVMYP